MVYLKGKPGKIAYGFGNFGQAFLFHAIGAYLIFFYTDVVHLDPALVSLAFLISYGIWNAINDPLAGHISDRTRTRWGRRIPFILFCTPLMVLLFVLVWTPPTGGVPLAVPFNLWIFFYFAIIYHIAEHYISDDGYSREGGSEESHQRNRLPKIAYY